MATSILLAAQEAQASEENQHEAAQHFLKSYVHAITHAAKLPVIEVARLQVHRIRNVEPLEEVLNAAVRSTPMHTLEQLTERKGKLRRFRSNPPILRRVEGAEAARVLASLKAYAENLLTERRHFLAQYRPVDVAFKVVGTGSVGLRDYCVFMEGNGPDDPLFLQIKEEPASAYAKYLPQKTPANQGQRVAEGQRAMQMQSDPFLGWTQIAGRDYLVRQINDHKASITVEQLNGTGLIHYAEVAGELLARGHARSGDVLAIHGYIGKSDSFADAIVSFAISYAERTFEDWQLLLKTRKASAEKGKASKSR
jgi:uncharacterized protein (DUF2252 family)